MQRISDFLQDLDARWQPASAARQPLHMIGSCALMLQTDYERGTKDSDVLRTVHVSDDVRVRLIELAGKDTVLHRRHARRAGDGEARPREPCRAARAVRGRRGLLETH